MASKFPSIYTQVINFNHSVKLVKLDGENTSIYADATIHTRALTYEAHWSRSALSGLRFGIAQHLQRLGLHRVVIENCVAAHGMYYDQLPSLYPVILMTMRDINNKEIVLPYQDTVALCQQMDLMMVPEMDSELDLHEGYVVRNTARFPFSEIPKNMYKWVRSDFEQGKLWDKNIPNKVTPKPKPDHVVKTLYMLLFELEPEVFEYCVLFCQSVGMPHSQVAGAQAPQWSRAAALATWLQSDLAPSFIKDNFFQVQKWTALVDYLIKLPGAQLEGILFAAGLPDNGTDNTANKLTRVLSKAYKNGLLGITPDLESLFKVYREFRHGS